MSALEKALRQIDAQRQQQAAVPVVPDFPFLIATAPRPRWPQRLLVVLAGMLVLLLVGAAWYLGRGWWSSGAGTLALPATATATATATAPVSAMPAAPVLAPPDAPAAPVASAPAVATAQAPVTAPATVAAPLPAGWHLPGEQLWQAGLHAEGARLWEQALRRLDPSTPTLQVADQQTQRQTRLMLQAWSGRVPMVAVLHPQEGKKRYMVLALPAASQWQQAQLQLSVAQGQLLSGQPLVYWLARLTPHPTPQTSPSVSAAAVPPAAAALPASAPATPAATVVARESRASTPAPATPAAAVPSAAGTPVQARAVAPTERAEPRDGNEGTAVEVEFSRNPSDKASATAATAQVSKSIEADFQSVEKLLARNDATAALEMVQKLERSIGENWRTRFLAGVALMGLGRLEDASTALAKAQQLNPAHLMAAIYHCVVLQERGEHGRAVQVVQKALENHPANPELWLNLGHSSQALGQGAQARRAYQRFLELSVSRPDLATQRAWVQARLQKDNG